MSATSEWVLDIRGAILIGTAYRVECVRDWDNPEAVDKWVVLKSGTVIADAPTRKQAMTLAEATHQLEAAP